MSEITLKRQRDPPGRHAHDCDLQAAAGIAGGDGVIEIPVFKEIPARQTDALLVEQAAQQQQQK